jgi:microcystin-dependent protein
MGSPVRNDDFTAVTGATSACDGFKRLLRIPGQLNLLLGWLLDGDGNLSKEAADGIADYLTPIGSIQIWAGASLPSDGWLVANGQAVSRTTYATLFLRIGTVYGSGDGTTTFNLPDLQGRFPRGIDATTPLGQKGGTDSITLSEAQVPSKTHYHGIGEDPGGDEIQIIQRSWESDGTFNVTQNSSDNPNVTLSITDSGDLGTTDPIEVVGTNVASTPIDNRPAFTSLLFIIKVL